MSTSGFLWVPGLLKPQRVKQAKLVRFEELGDGDGMSPLPPARVLNLADQVILDCLELGTSSSARLESGPFTNT